MLIDIAFFLRTCVSYNPARNGARNLSYQDVLPVGVSMTMVERSFSVLDFGSQDFIKIAIVVFNLLYDAIYRKPVGVYVP